MICLICGMAVTKVAEHVARSHGNIGASETSWQAVCPLCSKGLSGTIEPDALAVALRWNYQIENQDNAYQCLLDHIKKEHFGNN